MAKLSATKDFKQCLEAYSVLKLAGLALVNKWTVFSNFDVKTASESNIRTRKHFYCIYQSLRGGESRAKKVDNNFSISASFSNLILSNQMFSDLLAALSVYSPGGGLGFVKAIF